MQARDDLASGDDISHRDACDLVNWYADELDRVRNHYQSCMTRIADVALFGHFFPENAIGEATPPEPR